MYRIRYYINLTFRHCLVVVLIDDCKCSSFYIENELSLSIVVKELAPTPSGNLMCQKVGNIKLPNKVSAMRGTGVVYAYRLYSLALNGILFIGQDRRMHVLTKKVFSLRVFYKF